MNWIRIALAFVFFSNAAFLLLTGVLAWRVWLNTRRSREELARSARHVAAEMARLGQTADKAQQTFDQMRTDMALWLEECRARPAPPPMAAPRPVTLAGGFDALEDRELEAILAGVEAEKMRLNRKLEHLQDSLKRTLVEKEFIEDRFLVLDQARHAAATPPVAADVSPIPTPIPTPAD